MKLTEEKIYEIFSGENFVSRLLTRNDAIEVIARFKEAGLIEQKIEEQKYVVIFGSRSNSPFTFYNKRDKRCSSSFYWEDVLKLGSMTMEEIRKVDPRFKAFAVEVEE